MKDNLKLGFKKRFEMFMEGALKGNDTDVIFQAKSSIVVSLGMTIGIGMACIVLGYRVFIVSSVIDWYDTGWFIFLAGLTASQIIATIGAIKTLYKFKKMVIKPKEVEGAVTEEAALEIIQNLRLGVTK